MKATAQSILPCSIRPAVEAPAPRFPRAAALLETLAIGELLYQAATDLELLAAAEPGYSAETLRRKSHAVVRALFAELSGKVSL